MNVEAIKIVRDHIASLPPELFDMGNPCGSACCLGGHTNNVFYGDDQRPLIGLSDEAGADTALGLSEDQARRLFYPSMREGRAKPYHAEPHDAVRVLDHLLETGEVDWSIIAEPVAS